MKYKVGQVWTDSNKDTLEIIKVEEDSIPQRIVVKITYEDEDETCTDEAYFGIDGKGWDVHGHYKLDVLKREAE